MVNYYAELGLDRGLDEEGLKTELAKLRRTWQNRANAATSMEKQHEAENKMQLIREASAILLVKEERVKYDKKLDKDPALSGQQGPSNQQNDSSESVPTNFLDIAAAQDALEACYQDSKYNMAITLANTLIKNPEASSPNVYRILALCYIETNREAQAVTTIQNMVKAFPQDFNAHYLAAFFDLRLFEGRSREARQHLDWLLQNSEELNPSVAALDVEYYIDTGDLDLATAKTDEYKQRVGNNQDFTKNVGEAYRQHAESFLTSYGGDVYFDNKESFENWKKYKELAFSIYPNAVEKQRYKDNLKVVNGITFEKDNFPGIVFAFLLGAFLFSRGGGETALGVLFFLIGIYITVFSFIPKWMAHKAQYTGELGGLYLVAQWMAKVVGAIIRAIIWLFKLVWNLVWTLIGFFT